MGHDLTIKRIYESAVPEDGYRVLVDRLWPRGVSKERATLDEWNKDITPTPELRIWFGHKAERFEEFTARYIAELNQNEAAFTFVNRVRELLKTQNVTLLYGAKDPHINHAIVLSGWITDRL